MSFKILRLKHRFCLRLSLPSTCELSFYPWPEHPLVLTYAIFTCFKGTITLTTCTGIERGGSPVATGQEKEWKHP